MHTHLLPACAKRVCKSCIHKHSDKYMLDHNRNLQEFDLRKYIALSLTAPNTCLQIWNSLEAFESLYWWRKCLWDGCARELFLSMNSKLLLFTFKLLFPVEREKKNSSVNKLGSFGKKNQLKNFVLEHSSNRIWYREHVEEMDRTFNIVHRKHKWQILPIFLLIQ